MFWDHDGGREPGATCTIESSDVVTEVSGEGVPGGRPIAHSIRDKTTNYASIDDLHYDLSMRSVSTSGHNFNCLANATFVIFVII